MEKIKILIVDDVPQTRKDLIRLLYFEEDMEVVGEAGNGQEALQKIGELQPDVVLMDINMPQMDGITATEKAGQLYPEVAVVIISIQGEAEYLKKAMVAGARDYLVKPLSSNEMGLTIRSVYKQQQLRRASQYQIEPLPALITDEQSAGAAPAQTATKPAEEKTEGKVVVIFGGKGGCGKTTIATNLAVVLAQNQKKKVVLVDYDLQFGDIAVMLNLRDGNNISDLVQSTEKITAADLADYVIRHFSGIDILPAPLFPQDAEYVTAEHTETIMQLLKQQYDYVIVDTASIFNDINLQALEAAELILLVVTRDIPTIKNAKTSLNILETLNYREKIRVVLNRSNQDLGVDIPDLETGLEITVAYQIVSDEKTVISAINKGAPVTVSHAGAEISRDLRRLGERIATGQRLASAEKQKGLITRIFSL